MPIRYLQVRIRPDQVTASLAALEAAWQKISPDQPFDYAFLDEALDRRYRTEQNWTRIFTASAVLAILIACLGLFGLS
ncbi:MAG: ABC transporter permease, partial [Rhodothermales bacterium]